MSATFAETLRRIRMMHKLSQVKLASRAKCEHSYISRLELGGRMPTKEMVDRLVMAIGARDSERYELLTSAGYFCDLVIEHDLLALNDMLQDQRIDAAYRDSMRNTIKSLVSLGEQRTAQAPERWYAPLREVV